jgi:lipid II:glycine glycyltransferase (peptidoglycan interpeptide bridge formation enzyme)
MSKFKTHDGYRIDSRKYNPRIVDVYTPQGKLLMANIDISKTFEVIDYHRAHFPKQVTYMIGPKKAA